MSIQVETKDCTSISDAELAEMADLCAERQPRFDIGFLSKQREEWVLVTRAREGSKLRGYSFSTLERIGGTPSLLIGLATIDRTARADTVLRSMMGDKYRRALLAFPDEDVLVGTRLLTADGFRLFGGLTDVVPGPGRKATGEERAWGRRLAKRFGVDGRIDDRTFVVAGEGTESGGFDYSSPKARPPDGTAQFFEGLDPRNGERLVAFGWAMAEDLARGKLGR
ncbi:MAG: hypothetical protein ACYCVN_03590 [Acidimicrobiales bacterium]